MVAQAPNYKADVTTGQTSMTPAQQAQYKADYQAAKMQWAAMTPDQKKAALASARQKKIKDLSLIELVGQRDDMTNESAKQSAELKAQRAVAKAQWDKMTAEQKQAARKSAWEKKRSSKTAQRPTYAKWWSTPPVPAPSTSKGSAARTTSAMPRS